MFRQRKKRKKKCKEETKHNIPKDKSKTPTIYRVSWYIKYIKLLRNGRKFS